jgi:hypothetical protein
MNAAVNSPAAPTLSLDRQHQLLCMFLRMSRSALFGLAALVALILAFALFPVGALGYGGFLLVQRMKRWTG